MNLSDLPQGPFQSKREFHAAIHTAIACARTTLFMFDRDFSDWPLHERAFCAVIEQHARRQTQPRVHLLTRDPVWLQTKAPRFTMLRERYAHVIECRIAPPYRAVDEGVLIADDRHLLKRFHSDHFRGRLSLEVPTEVEALQPRYRTLWDEATPCPPTQALGL